jgi:ferredoxin-NADP reductase
MATVLIRPNRPPATHVPGQYLSIGIDLDGRRHWRAYTVTSEPGDPLLAVTVKQAAGGVVSGHLVRRAQAGDLLHLGDIEGVFGFPAVLPTRLLMISAGSGITPIIALLRALDRAQWPADVVHIACVRAERDLAFGHVLRALQRRHGRYRLHVHLSSAHGRWGPAEIDALCGDWRERDAFACGPGPLLDRLETHWGEAEAAARLRVERFQPRIDAEGAGLGGPVEFRLSGVATQCAGGTPILAAGLAAGARLPHGCQVGICRTCVGALIDGRVRDLRTGELLVEPRTMVRICVSAAEGPVTLEL